MRIIYVNSLPFKEVINDIGKELGADIVNQCDEYWLNIPPEIGEGSIRGVNFPGGLGIIQYDCHFKENVEIRFNVNQVHPLKFLYCEDGTLYHRFENEESYKSIQKYQCVVVASNKFNGHVLKFDAHTKTILNSLELDRKVFKPHIICEMQSLEDSFKRLFGDIDAKDQFYHEGNYSLQLADLFRAMKSLDYDLFERKIYLHGQTYLMLALQVVQFQDDIRDAGSQSLLRQSDLILIEEAAQIIRDKIGELGTIDKIAKKVGLNLNKMQTGFQFLYNMSVNSFIQNERMEKAKILIEKNEFNISEIVHEIGLSSKSYFSKTFRETYQMTPSEYRKRFRSFMTADPSDQSE